MEMYPNNHEPFEWEEAAADNHLELSAWDQASPRSEGIGDFIDQAPIGRYASELLSKPQAILYLAPTPDSVVAFTLLEKARIRFAACVARDRDVPVAQWGDLYFVGISGVKDLVKMLHELDEAFAAKSRSQRSRDQESADPRLKQWMEQLRVRQLDAARTVLKAIMEEIGMI